MPALGPGRRVWALSVEGASFDFVLRTFDGNTWAEATRWTSSGADRVTALRLLREASMMACAGISLDGRLK